MSKQTLSKEKLLKLIEATRAGQLNSEEEAMEFLGEDMATTQKYLQGARKRMQAETAKFVPDGDPTAVGKIETIDADIITDEIEAVNEEVYNFDDEEDKSVEKALKTVKPVKKPAVTMTTLADERKNPVGDRVTYFFRETNGTMRELQLHSTKRKGQVVIVEEIDKKWTDVTIAGKQHRVSITDLENSNDGTFKDTDILNMEVLIAAKLAYIPNN